MRDDLIDARAMVNAGVAAVVSCTQNSLDPLACVLAAHNGASARSDVHFPIYESAEDFFEAKTVAWRQEWLSPVEHQIVEELRPYRWGSDLIVALRQLDALRKRERLVDVCLSPGAIMHTPEAEGAGYRLNTKWPRFEDGAVLGGANINSPIDGFDIVASVEFKGSDLVSSQPALDVLLRFANLADEIIGRFEAS
jgi:hypothetical protein